MVTLGILKDIDFGFWLKSNDYYSPNILSTNVSTGIKHAKKAGLINELVEEIQSNAELINLIKQRINLKNSPSDYNDDELLIIFDLIQAWGGPMGRNPYVLKNLPRINESELFAATYRQTIEMLFNLKDINDYDKDVAPIKRKLEEIPQLGQSFSTKHLSFWSRFLRHCPQLVIYDTRMINIIKAANKHIENSKITYNDFRHALLQEAEQLGLSINDIERAIFAFSSNYFNNDELVLKDNPKISHPDKVIAHQLLDHKKPNSCLFERIFFNKSKH